MDSFVIVFYDVLTRVKCPTNCDIHLFGTKYSVSCITKSRADISTVIQFSVKMTYIDLYVRMNFVETLQTFRGSDNEHALDALATVLFNVINSGTM